MELNKELVIFLIHYQIEQGKLSKLYKIINSTKSSGKTNTALYRTINETFQSNSICSIVALQMPKAGR